MRTPAIALLILGLTPAIAHADEVVPAAPPVAAEAVVAVPAITSGLAGTITEGGAPFVGNIQLAGNDGFTRSGTTDETGHYLFEAVPPGAYTFSIYQPGDSTSKLVAINNGPVTALDVALPTRTRVIETMETMSLASTGAVSSPRSYGSSWLVLPSGAEVGTTLRFVTADVGLDGKANRFTDIALFGLRGRGGLGHQIELDLGVDILPKQPSRADEDLIQRFAAGLALGLGKQHAIRIDGATGPMLDELGWWGSTELSLTRRASIEGDFFQYQASLVGSGTGMRPEDGDDASLLEVIGRGELVLHTPGGEAGTWFGVNYSIPVAHSGEVGGVAIDPQPRVDLQLGGVIALPSGLDLFLSYSIIDRGDADVPGTALPILDGGFDQRQWLIGIERRFGGGGPS